MLYCHHCGRKIKQGNQFCPSCGKKLGGSLTKEEENSFNLKEHLETSKSTPIKPIKKEGKKISSILFFILLVVVVFAFARFKDANTINPLIIDNGSINDSNFGACPYACCLNNNYEEKLCPEKEKCIDNLCIDIEYPESNETGIVTKVIDGDTVYLESGKRIRLLGINSEERGQRCYDKARERLEELILNKEVKLETDIDNEDIYERLLRYIIIDDKNINVLLVEEGLASVYIVGENKRYLLELEGAEEIAKNAKSCIWEKSSLCGECIGISYFHLNAEGNDCENPNDEYIIFRNSCNNECDITNWTVKDEATHTYTFPEFVLKKQESVTLYSGNGTDAGNNFYWKNHGSSGPCPAIWNNDGDTVYLRDKEGKLVLDYTGF